MIPRLDEVGVVLGGGKLGQIGASQKAAGVVADLQGRLKDASYRAGKALGPILGTANAQTLAKAAGAEAELGLASTLRRMLGDVSPWKLAGFAAVAIAGAYFLYKKVLA